jgi:chromosome segregation ATPase
MQLFKLQQERKALRLEADGHCADKEKAEHKCAELGEELRQSNTKVDELNWELQQKVGEISLLKAQLKDAKEDTTNKSTDVIGLRAQVKDLVQERDQQTDELHVMSTELKQSREDFKKLQEKLDLSQTQLDEAQQTITVQKDNVPSSENATALQQELATLGKELSDARVLFTHEKDQWMDEKNKVVRYQKHLQLNYVQVMRKNKMLEDEVEQLTLELENRDIKLMTDGVALTEEESIC